MMATTTASSILVESGTTRYHHRKPMRVCFSYAAYAKSLIHHLKYSCNEVLVEKGLTDDEFSWIESLLHFSFPPDLRSILREGLPVGHGFPNWRSSSKQQLEILLNLPILEICKQVSTSGFWVDSWGLRPVDEERAVNVAKGFLRKAPILVPLYMNFYIPTRPWMAGNPIFYVHDGEIKVWSFDISGFFQQAEFKGRRAAERPTLSRLMNAPPWAATEARRIEFWTELVEGRERNWWSGGDHSMSAFLDEACAVLRGGGWKEQDVREMMMMTTNMDGCDEPHHGNINTGDNKKKKKKEWVEWHVRRLGKRLLRAGWSREDVRESFGIFGEEEEGDGDDEDSLFDFYCNNSW